MLGSNDKASKQAVNKCTASLSLILHLSRAADNLDVKSSFLPLLCVDGPGTGENCFSASSSISISSEVEPDDKIEYCSKLCSIKILNVKYHVTNILFN
jgi:hypothetical protein